MKIIFLFLTVMVPLCLSAQGETIHVPDSLTGKFMYESWCARCHGIDGRGKIEGLELDVPVPDFTDCSFTSREPRKDWLAVILHGGPARGLSMTMPAWGEAIDEQQAEAIISHIKTFCTEPGWPPGELNFRRAQVTAKAFPENEALVIPTYTKDATVTRLVYERRVGRAGQWEISLPLASTVAAGGGFGDVEIGGKYALLFDEDSRGIFSVGAEVGLPTGPASQGSATGLWKLSPYLAAGKGWEQITLQSSLKIERPLGKNGDTEVSVNLAVTVPLTQEKMGLFPMMEINAVHSEGSTLLFLTPQIYLGLVKRGHIALSIGSQIPVARKNPYPYKIVGFFLWEYADGGLWW
ncbi:MAG: hypothetical protein HBSIN02_02020 [Bacteroidia bacterium]|nr:MAG: hypothetical protein HBSIN02_02020 [Bacteroidia bacterium]